MTPHRNFSLRAKGEVEFSLKRLNSTTGIRKLIYGETEEAREPDERNRNRYDLDHSTGKVAPASIESIYTPRRKHPAQRQSP